MHRHIAALGVAATALAFVVSLVGAPAPALGEPSITDQDLSALQDRIEESGKAYDEATAKVEALNAQMEENEKRISEVEAQLPAQRERAAAAISSSYKMQQNTPGLVELILSSTDFNQFLSTVTYLNAIQSHNIDEAARLTEIEDELQRNKAELEQKRAEADAQQKAAADALDEAKKAREEAQKKAEEQARREAEAAAAALAAEKEAQEKAAKEAAAKQEQQSQKQEQQAQTPASKPDVPSSNVPSSVDWSSDKSAFVAKWQPRIDAYLAGSPLAGTGRTFAEAAWDYGVDPRWSPAISNTESSKGAVCFRPYNAWGWGNASWSNWDEAIRAHVSGLARGYGSTITYAAAQKYCPPNAAHWYNVTLAEMERI